MGNYKDFCEETFFKEIAVLKKEDGRFPTKSIEMKEHAGVWVMWGKKHSDDDYTCLEVGESDKIIKELNKNIYLLNDGLDWLKNHSEDELSARCDRVSISLGLGSFSKEYYKLPGEKRRVPKYRDIAKCYDELIIYEFCFDRFKNRLRSKDHADEGIRMLLETDIFMRYHAIYWNYQNSTGQNDMLKYWNESHR